MDRTARMTDAIKEKPRGLTDLPLPPEVRQRFQQLQVSRRFSRDPEVVRRILVRAPNWVGDAVMSLPVLAGLKRLFPLAELTVLAAPRVAPLFATQPGDHPLPVGPGQMAGPVGTARTLRRGPGLAQLHGVRPGIMAGGGAVPGGV